MRIKNESKSFSSRIILKQISFNFKEGLYKIEGSNGSGKTTLLHLLAGIESFDSGYRVRHKKSILYLDTNFIGVTPLTIEDNLKLLWRALNVTPNIQTLALIEDFFGNCLQDNYLTASVGTKAKLGLSLIFVKDWSYIFIDETLSTLDIDSVDMIARRLLVLKEKATVFYVSHNLLNKCLLAESKIIHLDGEGGLY